MAPICNPYDETLGKDKERCQAEKRKRVREEESMKALRAGELDALFEEVSEPLSMPFINIYSLNQALTGKQLVVSERRLRAQTLCNSRKR